MRKKTKQWLTKYLKYLLILMIIMPSMVTTNTVSAEEIILERYFGVDLSTSPSSDWDYIVGGKGVYGVYPVINYEQSDSASAQYIFYKKGSKIIRERTGSYDYNKLRFDNQKGEIIGIIPENFSRPHEYLNSKYTIFVMQGNQVKTIPNLTIDTNGVTVDTEGWDIIGILPDRAQYPLQPTKIKLYSKSGNKVLQSSSYTITSGQVTVSQTFSNIVGVIWDIGTDFHPTRVSIVTGPTRPTRYPTPIQPPTASGICPGKPNTYVRKEKVEIGPTGTAVDLGGMRIAGMFETTVGEGEADRVTIITENGDKLHAVQNQSIKSSQYINTRYGESIVSVIPELYIPSGTMQYTQFYLSGKTTYGQKTSYISNATGYDKALLEYPLKNVIAFHHRVGTYSGNYDIITYDGSKMYRYPNIDTMDMSTKLATVKGEVVAFLPHIFPIYTPSREYVLLLDGSDCGTPPTPPPPPQVCAPDSTKQMIKVKPVRLTATGTTFDNEGRTILGIVDKNYTNLNYDPSQPEVKYLDFVVTDGRWHYMLPNVPFSSTGSTFELKTKPWVPGFHEIVGILPRGKPDPNFEIADWFTTASFVNLDKRVKNDYRHFPSWSIRVGGGLLNGIEYDNSDKRRTFLIPPFTQTTTKSPIVYDNGKLKMLPATILGNGGTFLAPTGDIVGFSESSVGKDAYVILDASNCIDSGTPPPPPPPPSNCGVAGEPCQFNFNVKPTEYKDPNKTYMEMFDMYDAMTPTEAHDYAKTKGEILGYSKILDSALGIVIMTPSNRLNYIPVYNPDNKHATTGGIDFINWDKKSNTEKMKTVMNYGDIIRIEPYQEKGSTYSCFGKTNCIAIYAKNENNNIALFEGIEELNGADYVASKGLTAESPLSSLYAKFKDDITHASFDKEGTSGAPFRTTYFQIKNGNIYKFDFHVPDDRGKEPIANYSTLTLDKQLAYARTKGGRFSFVPGFGNSANGSTVTLVTHDHIDMPKAPPPKLDSVNAEIRVDKVCYGYEEAITLTMNRIETWHQWNVDGTRKADEIKYLNIKRNEANSVTANSPSGGTVAGNFTDVAGDKMQFKVPKSNFIGPDGRLTLTTEVPLLFNASYTTSTPTTKIFNMQTPPVKVINVPIYTGGPCEGVEPPSCANDITKCTTDEDLCTYHGIYCPIEETPPVTGGGVVGNIPPPQDFTGWPSWTQDDFITKIPVNPNTTNPENVGQLNDKDKSNKLDIRITNVPNNELLSVDTTQFIPEVVMRNNNDVYEFPEGENIDWARYTNQGNKTTVFILKVLDPSTLPSNPQTIFNWSSDKFEFKTTVTGNTNALKDYKISDSGYYVFGAKAEDKQGRTGYDFRIAKVIFTDNFGWLPVQNNLLQQVNQHMLVTNWDKGEHGMNLMLNNSLKIPSSYNYKQKVTAIGSYNGTTGVRLYKDDMSEITSVPSLPADAKITKIVEHGDGFLLSAHTTSLNSGLLYLDLKANAIYQIPVGSKNVNTFALDDKGNLIIGTSTGIRVGQLSGTTFTAVDSVNNFVLFGNANTQVGSIEIILGKILVTSKTGSNGTSQAVMMDTM